MIDLMEILVGLKESADDCINAWNSMEDKTELHLEQLEFDKIYLKSVENEIEKLQASEDSSNCILGDVRTAECESLLDTELVNFLYWYENKRDKYVFKYKDLGSVIADYIDKHRPGTKCPF